MSENKSCRSGCVDEMQAMFDNLAKGEKWYCQHCKQWFPFGWIAGGIYPFQHYEHCTKERE